MAAKRVQRTQGRPAGGSEEIVRAILDATLRQLEKRGYDELRVEDVARKAGVNKTSVYRRWPSKGELVVAALKVRGDDEPPFTESGELRRDLVTLLTAKAAGLSTPRGRKVLRALMAFDEEAAAQLSSAFPEGRYGKPRAVLAHAIERGALPPDADALFLTEMLLAPILHRILVLHMKVDEAFVARVVDHVLPRA
jgi:AcrR family transcriptional regulator